MFFDRHIIGGVLKVVRVILTALKWQEVSPVSPEPFGSNDETHFDGKVIFCM